MEPQLLLLLLFFVAVAAAPAVLLLLLFFYVSLHLNFVLKTVPVGILTRSRVKLEGEETNWRISLS
jgi:hypothetical protein